MKAIIHYDTGDTFLVIAFSLHGRINYIKFYYNNEPYILGRRCFGETGIIRVTNTDGETLWSLNT